MRIGEVARKVGVATSAIRFYEESGLLPKPERTRSGYRDYDPSVIDRLAFVRAGQAVGLTLGELREVLFIRDRGDAPCRHVTELIDTRIDEIDQRIEDLRRLRRDLMTVAGKAAVVYTAAAPPESICRILIAPIDDPA